MQARLFFEALIADNLDPGRPENVEIIFGRRVRVDTPGTFRTAIDRPVIDPDDKGVVVNVFYKHSRVKQHLKEGRALRIETVINSPRDLACNARLLNLDEFQDKARAINKRILEAERASRATVPRDDRGQGNRRAVRRQTGSGVLTDARRSAAPGRTSTATGRPGDQSPWQLP